MMHRLVLLILAGIALLAGLDAALLLLGLPAPVRTHRLPDIHGVVLVLGFVGTLIALERAVAARHRAGFAAPALLGLGALTLISPAPLSVGRALLVAGTGALVLLYLPLWRRQRDLAVVVQALGAVAATGAAVLWLGGVSPPLLLPWLAAFVILTISGERLELARLAMGPGAGIVLLLLACGVLVAIVTALLWPRVGVPLLGLVLATLTGWLAWHDIARATARGAGLPRLAAVCMLAGYVWLGIAAMVWLVGGAAVDGYRYDAVVHAIFVGFTISMIMAHAPVILPAVLRRPFPYHAVLYVPVVALQASLITRVWIGDALAQQQVWRISGAVNVASLVSFLGIAGWLVGRGNRRASRSSGGS